MAGNWRRRAGSRIIRAGSAELSIAVGGAEPRSAYVAREVRGPSHVRRQAAVSRELELMTFQEKHYFLVRRLHSLLGLVPIGAFLSFHLLANASILTSADGSEFQKAVDGIHALGPLVVPVEIVFIFLPLLFHVLLGFAIWFTASSNAQHYRYGPNIRYTLQRITGGIAFFFILYHVWQMHWFGAPLGGGKFDAHDAANTAASALQAAPWIKFVYALGVVACVYHLANGIWTSLITWGITIRPHTQRVSGYVCAVFGVVLSLVGLGALRGFGRFEIKEPAHDAVTAGLVTPDHGG